MLDMDIINAAMVRQNTPDQAAAAAASNAAAAQRAELDQDDFLTLMISQLKNQDPFKPMDPAEYVGQLAQFSSVSGLATMNKNITSLTDSLRGNQVLDGAALIGRTVIAEGNTVYRYAAAEGTEAIPTQGAIEVPAGASSVQLVVRDSAGTLVKSQALETRAGIRGFQLGRQHGQRHQRADRRLSHRSHRPRGRGQHFSQHQRRGAGIERRARSGHRRAHSRHRFARGNPDERCRTRAVKLQNTGDPPCHFASPSRA